MTDRTMQQKAWKNTIKKLEKINEQKPLFQQ